MRWLFCIILGAGLGLAAAMTDAAEPIAAGSGMRALQEVTHLASLWIAAGVLAGWVMAGAVAAYRPWSVLAGPVVLVAGVVGYRGYVELRVDPSRLNVSSVTSVGSIWLLAALAVGPMLGLVGGLAHSGALGGTLARLFVPVCLAVEVVRRAPLHSVEFSVDPVRAWTSALLLVTAVLGAAIATMAPQRSSQ
jgi:hypothetical protein